MLLLVSVTCHAQVMQQFIGNASFHSSAPTGPGIAQAVSCPSSGIDPGSALTGSFDYRCPVLATLSGNLGVVRIMSDDTNTPVFTVTDEQGDTWTQAVTNTTTNGNFQRIYYAPNMTAGSHYVNIHTTISASFFGVKFAEFYNVATTTPLDHAICSGATSTSIASGATGTLTTGDLIVQYADSDDAASTTSFTVGSQTNITWALGHTDLLDATAMQWGVYNSTTSFTPTFTQGTSHAYASCNAAFKAASAGTAPSATVRPLRMIHTGMPTSAANPYVIQTPALGGLLLISFDGGGDTITGITTSPSVTCTAAGTAAVATGNQAARWYCPLTSTSGAMTLSVTRSGATKDGTFILYDMTGMTTLDADSGGQTGNNATQLSAFITCTACVTPTAAAKFAIGNAAWDFCTAQALTLPSGAVFNRAYYTGDTIDGPQNVDQNNGQFYLFSPPNSALTNTYTMNCTGSVGSSIGNWAAGVSSFK